MSDQTHTTKFIWDTQGVDRGAKVVEGAYKRIDAAEKGSSRKAGRQNAIQGIKDLAEGRVIFGLSRLAKESKNVIATVAGIGIAGMAAAKAFKLIREEMRKNNEEAKRLEGSYNKVIRASTFSTSAEGFGSLAGKRASLQEQLSGERAAASNIVILS